MLACSGGLDSTVLFHLLLDFLKPLHRIVKKYKCQGDKSPTIADVKQILSVTVPHILFLYPIMGESFLWCVLLFVFTILSALSCPDLASQPQETESRQRTRTPSSFSPLRFEIVLLHHPYVVFEVSLENRRIRQWKCTDISL